MTDLITAEEARDAIEAGIAALSAPDVAGSHASVAQCLWGAAVWYRAELAQARADAKAAVAVAIEKAAERVEEIFTLTEAKAAAKEIADRIRALAPEDGLALVAALRAERDKWFEGAGAHHVASMKQAQRADRAETELAAANAREAVLREALEKVGGVRGPYGYPFPESNPDYGSFAVMTAREALASRPDGGDK